MSPAEMDALRDIRGYAGANRIFLTRHARRRMGERGATYEDIRHALMTAESCTAQTDGTYEVPSTDLDEEELTCIVALDDGDVIVTLF
jgi:hypothetical protein